MFRVVLDFVCAPGSLGMYVAKEYEDEKAE